MAHTSVVRAAILIALAAVLGAVVAPYFDFGWFSPKFVIIAVVFSVAGLRDLQGILLGFFGGVLSDTLGSGMFLFGVGAMGGVVAATLAVRYGTRWSKGAERFMLAQLVALSVGAYGLIRLLAADLVGFERPPLLGYLLSGVLPDAILNGLLAYLIGGWLLKAVRRDEDR